VSVSIRLALRDACDYVWAKQAHKELMGIGAGESPWAVFNHPA